MVSVDVREAIVAGWWRGWELCSELGSFGSTATWAKFNRLQFRTVIVYLVGGRQRTRRVTALTTYTLKNHEEVYMYT